MYKKVNLNDNVVENELSVIKFWNENKIFEKTNENKENSPVFTFFDGPPTANGMPHIGHVLTRAIKDLIPRYKIMKGYNVIRKAGWDTHGLPVELEVEKQLKISGKPQIEEYGVEDFIKKCKESVWHYENEWRKMTERVGFWVDMDDPYVTYHNDYIESVWWSLKQIWDKDLIYKGHKIVPFCPRCGTSLSSHEVAQGYQDVIDTTAIAKFKIVGTDNEYILAWTTTPWTLPSNVALAVNENEDYVKVLIEETNEKYILAKALLESALTTPYKIIEEFTGGELKGTAYVPLFDFVKNETKKMHYVVCDDYVTLTDGTGVVHIAPAFGEDDARLGRTNDLPFVQLVNPEGNFVEGTDFLEGKFIKDADALIISYLKENNTLYKAEKHEHNYPFCWRCHTPLMYYARDTWFIEMSKMRNNLTKNNNTVNWLPDNVKEGRFGKFLENVIDWGLSRERYWGTPLPIWECECGHRHMIGSIEELKSMSDDCPDEIELHKPYIDRVHLNCPECSGKMTRVTEVIDCWYDSGSMPFAQLHYPFENKEVFENNFPANFISEAIDQTRGWFYTLMAISTCIFEKSPYENVIVLGHVLDENGQKMSKHKGNVVSPWDVFDKQGADATRWYFYSISSPWTPSRFSSDLVEETQRKFIGTLKSSYSFFVLYANIDKFNPKEHTLDFDNLNLMDRWILSKLNSLVKFTDESLDKYKIFEPARMMMEFIDDLSNWYIRRGRDRYWAKEMPQDKINAYMTLYTVLETFIKVAAPFIPFVTEDIYQNLVKSIDTDAPVSIHLCDFPAVNENQIDKTLEENMDLVLKIVTTGRSARESANMKIRQPLGDMFVKSEEKLDDLYLEIVKGELNIKNVSFVDDVSAFSTYKFKPQLRTLGPKYGKILGKISAYLAEVNGNEFMEKLQNGATTFNIDDAEVSLTIDDVLYETVELSGFVSATDKNVTSIIKTELTEELIEEGYVRELVSKIQNMRKSADFEIMDKIVVTHSGNELLAKIIDKNIEFLKKEVMANEVLNKDAEGFTQEWNINGEKITLGVKR